MINWKRIALYGFINNIRFASTQYCDCHLNATSIVVTFLFYSYTKLNTLRWMEKKMSMLESHPSSLHHLSIPCTNSVWHRVDVQYFQLDNAMETCQASTCLHNISNHGRKIVWQHITRFLRYESVYSNVWKRITTKRCKSNFFSVCILTSKETIL